jgi:hypothetical protein
MRDLIIEQIQARARLDHGGDFTKAVTEYFRERAEWWQEYKDEVAGVNKRDSEERDAINAEIHYRLEWVAYRDKLDLNKPADWLTAQTKVFAEDPGLYKRHQAANTVHVGAGSLTD